MARGFSNVLIRAPLSKTKNHTFRSRVSFPEIPPLPPPTTHPPRYPLLSTMSPSCQHLHLSTTTTALVLPHLLSRYAASCDSDSAQAPQSPIPTARNLVALYTYLPSLAMPQRKKNRSACKQSFFCNLPPLLPCIPPHTSVPSHFIPTCNPLHGRTRSVPIHTGQHVCKASTMHRIRR